VLSYKNQNSFTRSTSGAIIIGGHVQGLANTRSLGKEGISVYVIDTDNCIARYSKYCQKFFYCPSFNSDELVFFLINLAHRENTLGWLLLPSNDHAVFTISKNKKKLSEYYRIATSDYEIFANVYDKSKLIDLAIQAGIPAPKTYDCEEVTDKTSFPLIIRGKYGMDFHRRFGKKAIVSDSYRNYELLISDVNKNYDINDLLIQELLPFNRNNRVVFCILYIVNGEILRSFVCQRIREHPFRNGTSTIIKAIKNEEVVEYSKKLAQITGLQGIIECEYLWDLRTSRYCLIEINVRTCLQIGLPIELDFNFPYLLYQSLVEELRPETKNNDYDELYWIHFWVDIAFGIVGLLKKEYSVRELLEPYKKKHVYAVYNKGDILPFIMETLMLPYLAVKRQVI